MMDEKSKIENAAKEHFAEQRRIADNNIDGCIVDAGIKGFLAGAQWQASQPVTASLPALNHIEIETIAEDIIGVYDGSESHINLRSQLIKMGQEIEYLIHTRLNVVEPAPDKVKDDKFDIPYMSFAEAARKRWEE